MPSKPREGALHPPSSRQHDDAWKVGAACDALEAQRLARPQHAHPIEPRAAGAAIGPAEPHAPAALRERLQPQRRPSTVLNARRMDDDHQQQAAGIDQDVPLASRALLPSVLAARRPSLVGRLDALRVQNGGGGL
jgi:hypothetical protein